MHIQIVRADVVGLGNEEWNKAAKELAPAFAEAPGLLSKVWLTDPQTGRFRGGIYTWRDRQAMESFAQSDLFKAVLSHPNLANITATDYSVMEAPTRVTRGLAVVPA